MTNNQKYARFPRSAFVGFDHIFKELEDMTKHASDHYPPHNIIKDEDMKYRIEVATAGFKEEELKIELKDGILEVNGDHIDYLNIHKLQELLWRTAF
jgi:HSP20 family molecular chaperone IbpA